MNDVDRRVQQAAESILSNERLTADLDDDAAQALLAWGVAWAEMIAESTAGLDRAATQNIMKPRLKATRRMMRYVNGWAGRRDSMDAAADRVLLGKVYDQAHLAATSEGSAGDERREAFVAQAGALEGTPAEIVTALQAQTEIALGLKRVEDDLGNG